MILAVKAMIAQIKADTGIQIVKGNTAAPQPAFPYGVYNITSPYIKEHSRGSASFFAEGADAFEQRVEQFRFAISFSFYADNIETTIESAFKIHQWFLLSGRVFLQEQNMAVVSVGNIQDRTTFLVEHYEYKHGFDVQFRATDVQTIAKEVIETIQ